MGKLASQRGARLEQEVTPYLRRTGLARLRLPVGAGADAVTRPTGPLVPSPGPAQNFAALGDDNSAIPPDTHGAVGPNHLMTVLNTQVRIQSRTGTALQTFTLDSFWAPLGNPNVFDPKVLYDPYAGRWMFVACADARAASSSVLLAVSETNDPTGNWIGYRVDADAANTVWADYPSIGFNKDWIVVQMNMFETADDDFVRSNIYVFPKAGVYAGANVGPTLLQDPTGFTQAPTITYDPDLASIYLVETVDGSFNGQGFLRLSRITGSVGSETLELGLAQPSAPAPWGFGSPTGGDFAPQLGSARKIMTNDDRMQNCVYRNGSIWCTHTIFLPAALPTRSSVQWWQLSPAGSVLQRGRVDDPAGTNFYAFPSIAANRDGNVLVGYSRFSALQYASANYAFRVATDPPNTLRDDTVLKAGLAKYDKDFGGGRNRWGDYSNTVVDPVDDRNMWTIQEYAEAPSPPSVDHWGTWWGGFALGSFADVTAPTDPSVSALSHAPSTWSSDRTVDVGWTGAGDAASGVDGFSFVWDTSPSTVPDQVKDAEETVSATTSPTLAEGSSHYFHLRTKDNAGNWTATVHAGPFFIDATLPVDPTLATPSHTPGLPSGDSTIDVTWAGASDAPSGVDGFSYLFDTSPATTPAAAKNAEETVSSATSAPLASGTYFFHLRTRDNAGNWTATVHAGPFVVDTAPPKDPVLTSRSHRVGVASTDRTIDVRWTGASDAPSGVDGFSYRWDRSRATLPDTTKEVEETASAATSPALPIGSTHYFHLRTRDNAGNWSTGVHLGPFAVRALRCVVPNVKRKTLKAAKASLVKARCTLGKVRRAYSTRIKKGRVISQRPGASVRLPLRGKVSITLSRGRRR